MGEDVALDRILPPTPQRRQRARREGNVARSGELTAAVMILGTLLALKALAPGVLDSWRTAAGLLLGSEQLGATSPAGLSPALKGVAWVVVRGTAPLLLVLMLLAVPANLVQVGFLLAPQRLAVRLESISPGRNLSRIFCGRSLAMTVMSLAKVAAVLGVGWLAVRAELTRLVTLQALSLEEAVSVGSSIVLAIGLKLAMVLLALSLLDYGLARWRHEQDLRLTPQETREEARRMDGDPQIRSRRRQIARQRWATQQRPRLQAVH